MISTGDLHVALEPVLSRPCVLLVHPTISRLQAAVAEIQPHYDWPFLPVGEHLSAALMVVPPNRRGRVARDWLQAEIEHFRPGLLVCTEIDLLFEPTLELDPLALFRQVSRKTKLIVLWPGTYENNTLAYAVPEHAHYKVWRKSEVEIIAL